MPMIETPQPATDTALAGSAAIASPSYTTEEPYLRIAPRKGLIGINWLELWQYRDLLMILAIRDIKVRYKQTLIGAVWAVLRPLLTMVVFTILFAALMGKGKQPSPTGIPYPVSTFCALLPWQFFAHALTNSGNSLVANQKLVTKIYFPRLLIPATSVFSGLVDFAISFGILLILMMVYGIAPSWGILAMPVFMLLVIITALGMGLWLAALNALYRDIRYIIPFLVQSIMFISPVVYDAQSVIKHWPNWAATIYMLNPVAGVVEGFRWALLGAAAPPMTLLAASAVGSVVLFLGGAIYFRRMERSFTDWI